MRRVATALTRDLPQPLARVAARVSLGQAGLSVILVERDERGDCVATLGQEMSVAQLRRARGLLSRELRNRANESNAARRARIA
jgi:hypothetical protein